MGIVFYAVISFPCIGIPIPAKVADTQAVVRSKQKPPLWMQKPPGLPEHGCRTVGIGNDVHCNHKVITSRGDRDATGIGYTHAASPTVTSRHITAARISPFCLRKGNTGDKKPSLFQAFRHLYAASLFRNDAGHTAPRFHPVPSENGAGQFFPSLLLCHGCAPFSQPLLSAYLPNDSGARLTPGACSLCGSTCQSISRINRLVLPKACRGRV